MHPRSEPLSHVDAAWLRMEEPTNLMTITGVMALDAPLGLGELAQLVESRLLSRPRFRQRLAPATTLHGAPRWEDDPTFDVRAHLHRVALPPPGGDAGLAELVSDLMSEPLDRTKPLWHAHLVEPFGKGCAIVVRLHHCIADGSALVRVLLGLTDPPAGGHAAGRAQREDRHRHPLARDEALDALLHPSHAVALAREGAAVVAAVGRLVLLAADPITLLKGPLGVRKHVAWTGALPLARLSEIGHALGGTVNDVLMTAIAGALRTYLAGRGQPLDDLEIRAVVPVDLRAPDANAELGNQFGLVFAPLPVGLRTVNERFARVSGAMAEIKRSPEAAVALGLLAAIGAASAEIEHVVVELFGKKASCLVTNVPGPREPRLVAGRPLSTLLVWAPQSGHVGLGVSILSYGADVRVGIGGDAKLVPDPDAIALAIEREIEAIAQEAARRH